MSGLHRVVTAVTFLLILLWTKHIFLPEDWIIHIVYNLAVTSVAFKYGMSYKNDKLRKTGFNVIIVGGGISGITMGVKLKEIGIDFIIFEKEKRLGGTCFSYYLNPNWSRSYSGHAEILRYIEEVAEHYKVTDHIRYGRKVIERTWDDSKNQWRVQLDTNEVIYTSVVISAIGGLHVPMYPKFEDDHVFQGDRFHSAEWPSDYDPRGKRVAVIGTGASAVQIIPVIAKQVQHLTVLQRTPAWVPPKDDHPYPLWLRTLFTLFPPLMYLVRTLIFLRGEFYYYTLVNAKGIIRPLVYKVIKQHYKEAVKDPDIRKKLIPSYKLGCKRITPSNNYLPTFNRQNVSLVTDGIKKFVDNGIETEDGTIHEVDTIVYATGFNHDGNARGTKSYGKKNKDLIEIWDDFPNAYKGIVFPGYPNSFFLLGPGTGLGHNSIIFMIESQVTYLIDALKTMVNKNITSIDVKEDVNDRYQEWVQKEMKKLIFDSSSCISFYKNKAGKVFALWPSNCIRYWWTTRKINLDDFHCTYQ